MITSAMQAFSDWSRKLIKLEVHSSSPRAVGNASYFDDYGLIAGLCLLVFKDVKQMSRDNILSIFILSDFFLFTLSWTQLKWFVPV